MKKIIMVLALGLACAGCQTLGASDSQIDKGPLVQLVTDKATQNGVPKKLAHAIIKAESEYNPKAISLGNYGLGQIRCGTARGLGFSGGCKELFDPHVNLTYSMAYLRQALDLAKDDPCVASMLYNQGLNSKVKKQPSTYCKKVLRNMKEMD